MAIIQRIMKSFSRPEGNDIVKYEIVDETARNALPGKADKITGGVEGNFVSIDENGNNKDSGHKASDFVTDVSGKADKVSGATADNFAGLDANGNLKDSGKKPSDFITEHQDISGKADKVSNANANDLAALDGNGNLKDSAYSVDSYGGTPSSSKLWTSQKVALELGGKTDKVSGATNGNLAGLNGSGNLTDSGISVSGLKSQIDGKADIIHDTVQNVAIASVPDAAANLPLTALRFAVEPIQAGSGDPSPQNVRSISGRTQAVVTGTGKNLFDKTIGTTDGIRGDDGTPSTSTASGYTDPIGGFEPETQYTIQGTIAGSTGNWRIYYLDKNGGWISRTAGIAYNDVPKTFTTPANCRFIQIQFIRNGVNKDTIQIEKGETAHAYTAYTGSQHTVQFGSTVYGASVDYVGGQTDDELILLTYDGSDDENWTKNGSNGYTTPISDIASCTPICDYLKGIEPGSSGGLTTWTARLSTALTYFMVKPDMETYSSGALWKAYLAQNPLHVLLKRATPIEIPLSNLDEIKTGTKGVLNVWADSGDIELMEYTCDTKLYVEKRLSTSQTLMELIVTANREDGMKATKAYSTGNLLIVNGTLYRATTSIANGATLTSGTNVTATTVAAELAALA